ncbi:MAG: hypothetical protein JNK04_23085, partial [Myxococcales bacterium]|nr:hypothetical protein [Myxococcales bacterium]
MRTLLPAVLVSLATGCGSATARLETTEAMPAAASSAAPPAEDAHGSPPAPRERFSWTAPIALEPVKGTSRVRRLSDQADWASTSPDSRHVITGRTYRDGGIADAELGRATLHPEGRKLPVTVVDDRGAVFSPDGRHVLVRSAGSAWRPRGGAAWQSARPRLTVLRVPSLAVVTEVDGADATWIGPRSIAFRRAAQAMRLDLDGDAPVPVGVSQRSFGCTAESFGPDTPCSSGRWSYLDAIDPSFTTWIVSDSCMLRLHTGAPPTAACHPHVAVRALDLSTGKSRTLAAAESVEDHIFADESPAASRVCFWL